ncbi:hypothetical protein D9M71_480380 [compost metagenome]
MRGRATAAALIEGDDPVQVGIKVATALGITASTRATMDEQHRQTFRRTALVDVQHMRCFHGQIVPGVGFDLRVQGLHYALRVGIILPLGIINLNCALSMPPAIRIRPRHAHIYHIRAQLPDILPEP